MCTCVVYMCVIEGSQICVSTCVIVGLCMHMCAVFMCDFGFIYIHEHTCGVCMCDCVCLCVCT